MPQTIIVPLDGSPSAERALGTAAAVAAKTAAEVVLLTARRGGVVVEPRRYLTDAAVAAGIEHPRAIVAQNQDAASAIADVVSTSTDPVVCMSTHARGGAGHALLGSVAEETLRRTSAPVLLVGPEVPEGTPEVDHLLVCLDGSERSAAILPIVRAWSRALGADVTLVTIVEPDRKQESATARQGSAAESHLQRLGQQLEGDCGNVTCMVQLGERVADVLVDLAERRPGTLLALTTHGRTGLARVTVGSVTMAVVRKSARPVLAVHAGELG